MKVFIPSKGRATTISTHKALGNAFDWKVVVHTPEEALQYEVSIPKERIIVSNQPAGISFQRQWVITNLVKQGEWFIFMDDNIKHFTAVPSPLYDLEGISIGVEYDPRMVQLFKTIISPEKTLSIFQELHTKAESVGAKYCGFATTDNYYFRTKRKWHTVGYVISKACLIQNTEIGYDSNIKAMDDYGFTAEHLKVYGRVLVNKFVHPVSTHYQKGGIGTYEQRLPKKIADCKYLMAKYPKMFRYVNKKTANQQAELLVNIKNERLLKRWKNNSTTLFTIGN